MTKENAAQYLPLVQALHDGKTIQCNVNGTWEDVKDPNFYFHPERYRVKPEPREWWLVADNGNVFAVCETEDATKAWIKGNPTTRTVHHVREVIE